MDKRQNERTSAKSCRVAMYHKHDDWKLMTGSSKVEMLFELIHFLTCFCIKGFFIKTQLLIRKPILTKMLKDLI